MPTRSGACAGAGAIAPSPAATTAALLHLLFNYFTYPKLDAENNKLI